ncbi:hypothetical protein VCHA50P415_80241 [Vibrio chagasii]|nr:hypothetical protein VCHA34P129_110004 [Vibrio chagasii]CAH6801863.1 hypothetical protein VCHA32P90_110172 [Vibrio chagasii]CAH6826621.1 hypothetical protein VCHA30O60_170098 [Vibrio chagasii]CAH6828369.1 hypothetical protein VCHA35O135_160104 [Vibrio chagasii]CAH6829894.1 hypothetical protein VCHA34P114_10104 [Vibrio chagasii]
MFSLLYSLFIYRYYENNLFDNRTTIINKNYKLRLWTIDCVTFQVSVTLKLRLA